MKVAELVAYNVRRLRTKSLISQETLAIDSGVARTHVSRIERGLENCTIGILEKFAEVIGCRVGEFFDEPDGSEVEPLKAGRKKK
jgi:transcriptional regulator with XRE-family HTH domain